ncbi:MAG: hypothetical protein IJV75_06355 [Alphaproteobacteria bacterium]|nr:hypothetical protein [Alphaproteobacteria bacterium]
MAKKSDIPFSTDPSRLFLPWISMLMIFIATLTLAGGLSAYKALSYWNKSVSASITVQIPIVDDKGKPRGEEVQNDIEKALTILRTNPGILGAKVLEETQMRRLMTPWLGEHADIKALPLPHVIDVTVDTINPPNIEELNTELIQFVPLAVLDSHRVWLDTLITIAGGLMKLTIIILALLLITTAFTVSYSAKTSLSMHKHVIALVHMMGANDSYIAWQYAIRILKLTLLGGLSGLVLALPIIFGVGYFFETIAGDFKCKIDALMLIILISTPFAFALLAFISTLKTVSTALKRMI